MTRILGLVLLVTLAGSGAAWAKAVAHKPAKPHVIRASTHAHKVRKGPIHHRSRLAALAASQARPLGDAGLQADGSGRAWHAGLFKAKDSAGWGYGDGHTDAVVGMYKRPEHPDIPDNQIYRHDGRGAAGVSLSFKLGQ